MRISSRRVLPLFALLAIPLPVFADPITVVSIHRDNFVQAFAGSSRTGPTLLTDQDRLGNELGARVGDDFGSAGAFMISQTSAADRTFTAHGNTHAAYDSTTVRTGGDAQIDYGVTFDVNEAQQFVFGGVMDTFASDPRGRSIWEAELFFFPPGPGQREAFHLVGTDSRRLLETGLLMPGRYGFFFSTASDALAIGTGRTSADFNFSLQFFDPSAASPTPEPASMLLLGSGLVGLVTQRRRQKRSA